MIKQRPFVTGLSMVMQVLQQDLPPPRASVASPKVPNR
jgi:hypothetical protein